MTAKQTHCKRGHEFTPENTAKNSRGSNLCKTCRAASNAKRREVLKRTKPGPGGGAHNVMKTHCPHGHEYDDDNTRFNTQGARVCIACVKIRRAATAKKRAAGEVAKDNRRPVYLVLANYSVVGVWTSEPGARFRAELEANVGRDARVIGPVKLNADVDWDLETPVGPDFGALEEYLAVNSGTLSAEGS